MPLLFVILNAFFQISVKFFEMMIAFFPSFLTAFLFYCILAKCEILFAKFVLKCDNRGFNTSPNKLVVLNGQVCPRFNGARIGFDLFLFQFSSSLPNVALLDESGQIFIKSREV